VPAVTYSGPRLEPDVEDKLRTLIMQLPPPLVAMELIRSFFNGANWYFLILEKYYFNQLHSSWLAVSDIVLKKGNLESLSRDLQYFPALLFQVLAVALQFLPPGTASAEILHLKDTTACDRLSQEYSKTGMDIMDSLGRHDSTVTAVQHDLMRALWLKNCSRGTESWYSLGNAIRSMTSSKPSKNHADFGV
jgi:hypothetical protein